VDSPRVHWHNSQAEKLVDGDAKLVQAAGEAVEDLVELEVDAEDSGLDDEDDLILLRSATQGWLISPPWT